MLIKSAILGILSWKPSSGYELKKIFEDSSFMHWSGNNNQIYGSLNKLEDEKLVTSEVVHQENSPSKKIYTISEEGLRELKESLISKPEAPDIRKTFLVQLAWSHMLTDQEIIELLSNYENELIIQLGIEEAKSKKNESYPNRSSREILLWEMISQNMISTYKNELNWVKKTGEKLLENKNKEGKEK